MNNKVEILTNDAGSPILVLGDQVINATRIKYDWSVERGSAIIDVQFYLEIKPEGPPAEERKIPVPVNLKDAILKINAK